jgi:hypothetical protein
VQCRPVTDHSGKKYRIIAHMSQDLRIPAKFAIFRAVQVKLGIFIFYCRHRHHSAVSFLPQCSSRPNLTANEKIIVKKEAINFGGSKLELRWHKEKLFVEGKYNL